MIQDTSSHCKDYCENPDNFDACLKFAEENGLIDPKELEMAKKLAINRVPAAAAAKRVKPTATIRIIGKIVSSLPKKTV